MAGIGLLAVCGIHEDPREIECATLSPPQARKIARALNKAAKLAERWDEHLAARAVTRVAPVIDGEGSREDPS